MTLGGADLDASALAGRWRLLSWETVDDDGRVLARPFGERPRGLVVFSVDGWAAVQIAAQERPDFGGQPPHASVEDRARAYASYLAYAGRYTVRGDTLVISPELSLYPQLLAEEQVRHVVFRAGDLVLRTPSLRFRGAVGVHELRWRRDDGGRAS